MNMKKTIVGFLSFSLAITILVVAMKVINGVPLIARKDALRRYASIEEVRNSLNIREIYVPAYFPQDIVWPPSGILAQGKPFPAVMMEFKNRNSGEIELVLCQSRGGQFPLDRRIDMTSVKETVPFLMKGRRAVLVVGECAKNEPCSKITWEEGDNTVAALMKAAPFELNRLAESMIR